MNPKDVDLWARKFARKGPGAAVQRAVQPAASAPPPAPYPPPAGYQPAPQHNGPVYQQGAQHAPRIPHYQPVETDVLCKPGPSGYADLLNSVPDLSTGDYSQGGDAMQGAVNPALTEFWRSGEPGVVADREPPKSFPVPIQPGQPAPLQAGPAAPPPVPETN
jgi:hypothetical protein